MLRRCSKREGARLLGGEMWAWRRACDDLIKGVGGVVVSAFKDWCLTDYRPLFAEELD